MNDIDQIPKIGILKHKTNISDQLPNYFKIKGVNINIEKMLRKKRKI